MESMWMDHMDLRGSRIVVYIGRSTTELFCVLRLHVSVHDPLGVAIVEGLTGP